MLTKSGGQLVLYRTNCAKHLDESESAIDREEVFEEDDSMVRFLLILCNKCEKQVGSTPESNSSSK